MTDKCDEWDFDPKNRRVIKPLSDPNLRAELAQRAKDFAAVVAVKDAEIARLKEERDTAMTDRFDEHQDALAAARVEGVKAGLEAAAQVAPDSAGREWVKGSLWDVLAREMSAKIAALNPEEIARKP